ncbi:hypothetical protein ACFL2C_00975 [Patescibacteria group bacterium]
MLHSKALKKYLFTFLPILCISLVILWPSFNLAVTGDDYLGLWRYNHNLGGFSQKQYNNFTYLLTDYGPQDSFTALIHRYVGFQSIYYYVISFILRIAAAISLYPLVKYITKNKTAAVISVLFFSITTTGLETTDWVFNAPSYVAILFFSIFFLFYLKAINTSRLLYYIISYLFFLLCVISQPIRMGFLPLYVVVFEIVFLLFNFKAKNIKNAIVRLVIVGLLTYALFSFTEIGGSIGLSRDTGELSNGFWSSRVGHYFRGIHLLFVEKSYTKLFNPIAQLGSTIFPNSVVPHKYESLSNIKILIYIILPLYLVFLAAISLTNKHLINKVNTNVYNIIKIIAIFWPLTLWVMFVVDAQYPIQTSNFIVYIVGGYLLLFTFLLFLGANKTTRLGIAISITLIVGSYIVPWVRNPGIIQVTFSRYLVVPAVGVSILIGVIASVANTKNKALIIPLLLLVLLHAYTSNKYLSHLADVRNTKITEKIRESVPRNDKLGKTKEPIVYYFETDNKEVLHHSLMFGFPVILALEQNFKDPWSIAYTQNWDEVEAAYKDGSGLKRFMHDIKKVELDNIHSFYLKGDTLKDTTESTRDRLEKSNQQT